jgi:hypothetical protein
VTSKANGTNLFNDFSGNCEVERDRTMQHSHGGFRESGRQPLRDRSRDSRNQMTPQQHFPELKACEPRITVPLAIFEPWRDNPQYTKSIGLIGVSKLRNFLQEEFVVEPRFNGSDYPAIKVKPSDLFTHILEILAKSERFQFYIDPFVEVYGGTAKAVVAADAGIEVNSPTDFDARFHVAGRDQFDKCRCIVENYIVGKLNETRRSDIDGFYNQDLVRRVYFQKQVS